MTVMMDSANSRTFGSQLSYDSLSCGPQTHFTNPWSSNNNIYHAGFDSMSKNDLYGHQFQQTGSVQPLPPLSGSTQLNSTPRQVGYPQVQSSLDLHDGPLPSNYNSADLLQFSNASTFPSIAQTVPASRSSNNYPIGQYYTPSSFTDNRRQSHTVPSSQSLPESATIATSNSVITPRNIYGSDKVLAEDYGFPVAGPGTHSHNSSISSASYTPASSYYAGSVGSSLSDYGDIQTEIEASVSRTFPPTYPSLSTSNTSSVVSLPPAHSMMSQFNSKVPASSQKKHRCKVCDKRFTRPSSLQTHMYSHTGEKPYACEHAGCGRHFSVVSNLRRHRKVHKMGDCNSDSGRAGSESADYASPEGSWSSEH